MRREQIVVAERCAREILALVGRYHDLPTAPGTLPGQPVPLSGKVYGAKEMRIWSMLRWISG